MNVLLLSINVSLRLGYISSFEAQNYRTKAHIANKIPKETPKSYLDVLSVTATVCPALGACVKKIGDIAVPYGGGSG